LAPAIKAALLCVMLGGSAIGYVYQKNQIADLGKQIGAKKNRAMLLEIENAELERTLESLKSPAALAQRVKALKLDLVPPTRSQLLTILEVPPPARPKSEPAYVERSLDSAVAAVK
jgi:hypothetical protein